MYQIQAFSQNKIMARVSTPIPTAGLCFRVTFKWAACNMAGGRFKYNESEINADKTASKHVAYRQETLRMYAAHNNNLSASAFSRYVLLDWHETRDFVNNWGQRIVDADKAVFSGISVFRQRDESIRECLHEIGTGPGVTVLAVFYGHNSNGSAWGHVVAFCGRGAPGTGGPCFFDSNYGVYGFSENDDIGTCCWDFIKHNYGSPDAFNTMVLR
ncbi:hypothetical protein [Pseudomonas sp. H3(2019)]|uniref:hypothetical protein n=1 Tax=Pseudomonas sp. H3(2019) TaxID=2598724 RepID=UPI001196F715|nr:hypothetical protein [Pseudomonas sp. H3(2019)]TVT83496.1 hypothetical protein FPT12_12190 [Pseudomonas sp. H3(2019)]